MPNHLNAKKMNRKIEKRRVINLSRINRIRTFIKNVKSAVISGNKESALNAFKLAQPEIQRGVTKRIFNKNKMSRIQSRLSSMIKKMPTIN